MRHLLAALAAVAILGTGCVVHVPGARSSSAVSAKKCPPGHVWSDGRCHETGRGRDKHER